MADRLAKKEFMDDSPDPSQVPGVLIDQIMAETTRQQLCNAWDRMYPRNPVADLENQEYFDDNQREAAETVHDLACLFIRSTSSLFLLCHHCFAASLLMWMVGL